MKVTLKIKVENLQIGKERARTIADLMKSDEEGFIPRKYSYAYFKVVTTLKTLKSLSEDCGCGMLRPIRQSVGFQEDKISVSLTYKNWELGDAFSGYLFKEVENDDLLRELLFTL